MNKYFFKIDYSCNTYGRMSGIVYANNADEALEKIEDGETHEREYDDSDSDNYSYYTDDCDLTLEEENVDEPVSENHYYQNQSTDETCFDTIDQDDMPGYFLSEIILL